MIYNWKKNIQTLSKYDVATMEKYNRQKSYLKMMLSFTNKAKNIFFYMLSSDNIERNNIKVWSCWELLDMSENMSFIDSTSTISISIADINTENGGSISSEWPVLEDFAEKVDTAVNKAAKERNLEKFVILQRLPPIDICVFGQSGIGKSELIKAITHLDIPTSAQIDHVTQTLTEATTTIGPLQFRFWDTKGIDNWLDLDVVDNLFNEMKERNIQPIFIIYCAAAGGRVDSDIIAAILNRFQTTKIPICYVITNIYAASSDQLIKEVEGGRLIMDNIFDTLTDQIRKLCFKYGNVFKNDDSLIANRQGILIGVNSCPLVIW